jgi:ribosomal protein L28
MANRDALTGKGSMFGGHRKHRRGSSGGGGAWSFRAQTTLRQWKPNLRKVKLENVVTGKIENLKISMKTYKKLRQGSVVENYKLSEKTSVK